MHKENVEEYFRKTQNNKKIGTDIENHRTTWKTLKRQKIIKKIENH